MTDAQRWLAERTADAPQHLRERMFDALANASGGAPVHDVLAAGASACLQRAMGEPDGRASALDLLAADALLTHACEAAAAAGSDALTAFAAAWNAERFEALLPAATS